MPEGALDPAPASCRRSSPSTPLEERCPEALAEDVTEPRGTWKPHGWGLMDGPGHLLMPSLNFCQEFFKKSLD